MKISAAVTWMSTLKEKKNNNILQDKKVEFSVTDK